MALIEMKLLFQISKSSHLESVLGDQNIWQKELIQERVFSLDHSFMEISVQHHEKLMQWMQLHPLWWVNMKAAVHMDGS